MMKYDLWTESMNEKEKYERRKWEATEKEKMSKMRKNHEVQRQQATIRHEVKLLFSCFWVDIE